MKRSIQNRAPAAPPPRSAGAALYEPLEYLLVRAPLLPIETYLALGQGMAAAPDPSTAAAQALDDPRIRRALAVGGGQLLSALERSSPDDRDVAYRRGKLLRYLIRMSSRPTPYGLFAGVALGRWGPQTDLALAPQLPRTRTRPDMEWLLTFALDQEARPEVRACLRFVANPAAWLHGDRVFLAERAPTIPPGPAQAVSLRATGVVRRALAAARTPIPYRDLVDRLLVSTPGATLEKVERLIADLWVQTLLLTDLRPPLTADSPARYVARRLAGIPAARAAAARLEAILEAAAAWDARQPEPSVEAYRQLADNARALVDSVSEPLQVDMALALKGRQIAQAVGDEVARAAELLLRQTPLPQGPPHLAAYRRAFESRYGYGREVPLLELLDPDVGLGHPARYGGADVGGDPARSALRQQTLRHLALTALRDRRLVVTLDDDTLARLETWSPAATTAPPSLDINVFVAAATPAALDAGQFAIVIGPNLGAQAAGRNLGRFADLLGPEAHAALARIARAEAARAPGHILAELVYLPPRFRAANVAVRPAVREYEIALAASPGIAESGRIPLDELVVGVRDGRFCIRWPARDAEVVICVGHMLTTHQAPVVCQFLADVSRDGQPQLSAFDWGMATGFPFLPRVQVGRVVLRPAQWRIDALVTATELPAHPPDAFRTALGCWRAQWQVPRYVYLSAGDNRLLLDLEDAAQAEELRAELRNLREGGQVVLQEAIPALDQIWLAGPGGHFMAELVVSLARRPDRGAARAKPALNGTAAPGPAGPPAPPSARLRPPGSEWLFVKLYCRRDREEELLAGPLRVFAEETLARGMAEEWFFIRYSDPDPHIRLRFHGTPERLARDLMPALCTWGAELMDAGLCLRFSFDTYDREVERYGGPAGTAVAEAIFAADSRTIARLLHLAQAGISSIDRTTLGVLSVDDLLAGLGLDKAARLQWYRQQNVTRHTSGPEYRRRKTALRRLLADPDQILREPGGSQLAEVFAARRAALVPLAGRLAALLERGELQQPPHVLYRSFVHLHCNRLLGIDGPDEQHVLGLLVRTREGLERNTDHILE